jgi:hypothetical protein
VVVSAVRPAAVQSEVPPRHQACSWIAKICIKRGSMGRILLGVVIGVILIIVLFVSCVTSIF